MRENESHLHVVELIILESLSPYSVKLITHLENVEELLIRVWNADLIDGIVVVVRALVTVYVDDFIHLFIILQVNFI